MEKESLKIESVKIKSSWSMTGILTKRWPCEERQTQGRYHVMTKADFAIIQLRAKQLQRLPANHQKKGEKHETDSSSSPKTA